MGLLRTRKRPVWWLLPDPHFSHEMLITEGLRPPNYEELLLLFIENNVFSNDVIVCTGDFLFAPTSEAAEKFAATDCRKILIRGNHDKKSIRWYMNYGFEAAMDEMKVNMFGATILISHKPVVDRDDFDINIHGHLHKGTHHPECVVNDKCVALAIEDHYTMFDMEKVVRLFMNVHGKLQPLYCDECYHLHPKEAEQSGRTFYPHMCRAGMGHLYHGGEHPRIPRPANCIKFEPDQHMHLPSRQL